MTTSTGPSTATRFPTLEVAGSPREMGRQIGEALRSDIQELTQLVVERVNKGRAAPISRDDALRVAAGTGHYTLLYSPDSMDEVIAVAEAAEVSVEDVMLINCRNMFFSSSTPELPRPQSAPSDRSGTERGSSTSSGRGGSSLEGCTSVMIAAESSDTGGGITAQNWDNDPEMDRFSLVLTRRPKGKPAYMSWTQPGIIAYMGINDAGIGVSMNALNGPARLDGVPWYFVVRSIFEQTSLAGTEAAAAQARRSITANAAMITPEGPADLEITLDQVRMLRSTSDGLLVHTNHCVHPDLAKNNDNFPDRIYGQSFPRRERAGMMLQENGGRVSLEQVKTILSDHNGYPTSICRHPNDDPATGWQRSVVSLILEPSAGRMHVSRGNPCEALYETYELN